jgi:hypothetical protein
MRRWWLVGHWPRFVPALCVCIRTPAMCCAPHHKILPPAPKTHPIFPQPPAVHFRALGRHGDWRGEPRPSQRSLSCAAPPGPARRLRASRLCRPARASARARRPSAPRALPPPAGLPEADGKVDGRPGAPNLRGPHRGLLLPGAARPASPAAGRDAAARPPSRAPPARPPRAPHAIRPGPAAVAAASRGGRRSPPVLFRQRTAP